MGPLTKFLEDAIARGEMFATEADEIRHLRQELLTAKICLAYAAKTLGPIYIPEYVFLEDKWKLLEISTEEDIGKHRFVIRGR
jgi:hypothetical protein